MSDSPPTRPYSPPPLANSGSVETQLAALRITVALLDRDVHELSGARQKAAAQAARIEERVEAVQDRLVALDSLADAVAGLRAEQEQLRRQITKVGGLLGGVVVGGQALLHLRGVGGSPRGPPARRGVRLDRLPRPRVQEADRADAPVLQGALAGAA